MNRQRYLKSISRKPKKKMDRLESIIRDLWTNRQCPEHANKVLNQLFEYSKQNRSKKAEAHMQAYDIYLRDIEFNYSDCEARKHAMQLIRQLRVYHIIHSNSNI